MLIFTSGQSPIFQISKQKALPLNFRYIVLNVEHSKYKKAVKLLLSVMESFPVESKPIHDWPIFKESLEGRDQVDAVSPIDLRDYHQLMPSLLLGGVL